MSSALLTRAQFRDSIRRCLGIIPPIDVLGSGAAFGDQPSNSPKPTNQEINQALENAVSDSNRAAGWHVDRIAIPVIAQPGGIGPLQILLSTLAPITTTPFTTPGRINDVRKVVWFSGDAPIEDAQLLTPVYRDNLDRSGLSRYWSEPPGTPRQWYVEEYCLFIVPAQNVGGAYEVTFGTGITGLQCEADTIDQIPSDYQNILIYGAVYHLSIAETQDVEWADRAKAFGALFAAGIVQLTEWAEDGTGAPQPTIPFATYRIGYGRRRVVR